MTSSVDSRVDVAPIVLRPLRLADPWRWLRLGWRDALAAPGIALFYGMCFWGMALLLGAVFRAKPEFVMSMVSGCLLLGPFLTMGLYDVSRRREAGQVPQLGHSITCWDKHMASMGMLVMVLLVLEMLWGRASLIVFAVFFNTGMPSTAGVLQVLFHPDNWSFIAVYVLVGSVFASVVFCTTVISIPMILDRDTDALTAGITSMRVVFGNLAPMLLWGALITALVIASLVLLWGAPLLLIGPLLGHASWHAYRSAVEPLAQSSVQPAPDVPVAAQA